MISTLYMYRPLLNAARLAHYAEAVGLQNVVLPVDMHVTLAYSSKPVDWNNPAFYPDPTTIIASGGRRTLTRFGDVVVLEFDCRIARQRWSRMILEGATWDHTEYRPHVTLAYDSDASLSGIIAPQTDLRFGPERREPLNENWTAQTA